MVIKKKTTTISRSKVKKETPRRIAKAMINKWNSFTTKTSFTLALAEKTAAWEKNN